MLSKAGNSTLSQQKVEGIASTLVIEDHLKSMLLKSSNVNYKPWNNSYAPKNPHSAFGNFPSEYKIKK